MKSNTILTCATANYCFFSVAYHIRKGEAEITVAGGTEAAVMSTGIAGFKDDPSMLPLFSKFPLLTILFTKIYLFKQRIQ